MFSSSSLSFKILIDIARLLSLSMPLNIWFDNSYVFILYGTLV